MASKQEGTQIQYEKQAPNFFQQVAIRLNVRYNAGISFPPTSPNVVASLWYTALSQHGAHAQVALGRMPNQPTQAIPLIIRQPLNVATGSGTQTLAFPQPSLERLGARSLSEVVRDNLYPETPLPATGPARLFLYLDNSNAVVALVVNVCSALLDATTIKNTMQSFMDSLHRHRLKEQGKNAPSTPAKVASVYTKLGGWEPLFKELLEAKPVPEPKYLSFGDDPGVPIIDILPGEVATGSDRRISRVVDAETLEACRQGLQHDQATLNSLCSACFNRALAEAYFSRVEKPNVTIVQSAQIDPRTVLEDSQDSKYLHAIGILPDGRTFQKEEMEKDDDAGVKEWLLKEAVRVAKNTAARTKRGEGMRKTWELVSRTIDKDNILHPAMELVDHGIYNTPSEEYEIELGHRFDPCALMSVVTHIEKAKGVLKLEAQIGDKQGLNETLQLFDRCIELWKIFGGIN